MDFKKLNLEGYDFANKLVEKSISNNPTIEEITDSVPIITVKYYPEKIKEYLENLYDEKCSSQRLKPPVSIYINHDENKYEYHVIFTSNQENMIEEKINILIDNFNNICQYLKHLDSGSIEYTDNDFKLRIYKQINHCLGCNMDFHDNKGFDFSLESYKYDNKAEKKYIKKYIEYDESYELSDFGNYEFTF